MAFKVQYGVSVLLSCAHLILTFPMRGKECKMCPAGEFQKSCEQCAPCPAGRYTEQRNREDSCHRCYGDCRPEFHQVVSKNCSSTSNLKCTCRDGFRCAAVVAHSDNCKKCVATATTPPATTMTKKTTMTVTDDEQTSASAESNFYPPSCSFPDCDKQPGNSSHAKNDKSTRSRPVAILLPLVAVATATLAVALCICRHGEETCLKQAAVKLKNKGGSNAGAKVKSTDLSSLEPCGAVHVHNAGTVVFSWLGHFTGQEEGKDWHLSKEEAEA
ncbi:uncharacterized protein LOC144073033 isoform X2 [Stigmatopora argus]